MIDRFSFVASAVVASLAIAAPGCKKATPPPAPPPSEPVDRLTFENPGGMWMPSQLDAHADTLRELGLQIDPAVLTDPTAFPLGAIVSLGGCSASFVSPQGLVVTNHHCVTGELQNNSTTDRNLLTDGFLAKTRADELPGGPGSRVYVTTAFTDVTARVRDGLDAIEKDDARTDAVRGRIADLTEKCEAGKPSTRCQIASYFDGAQYVQIEQLEIRDVRLVYAPPRAIGEFGGEIDNWQWPRHTGDYSFLRAYVGPDGTPADPAPKNVPYRPPHHLKIASTPLAPGDFAMVAGYPGTTYRLKTAAEVDEAVQWRYPKDIARYDATIALLERLGAERPELAIISASRMRGLKNYRKNFQGMLDGLVTGGLAQKRATLETQLRAWIDADPTRKQAYGDVLPQMDALVEARKAYRDHEAAFDEIAKASALLRIAGMLHEVARSRTRGDEDEIPPRQLAEIRTEIDQLAGRYDPQLDAAMLGLALRRAAALPEEQRPDALITAVLGKAGKLPLDDAKVERALAKIFADTKLGDPATREQLLTRATAQSIVKSHDPVFSVYARMRPLFEAQEQRTRVYEGAMTKLRPRYVAALRELSPTPLAPDANGTLRITYGTVRGYRPRPDAAEYTPFTTMSQMLAKHTGESPFDVPGPVLEAARAKRFGPYVDERLGDLPLNFLADLDITGGNSGSATLNARGELIGLAFDGNYESIAADWIFLPDVARSIHVDIRYVLWLMDAVDGADHLVRELGATPAIDGPTASPSPSPVPAAAAG